MNCSTCDRVGWLPWLIVAAGLLLESRLILAAGVALGAWRAFGSRSGSISGAGVGMGPARVDILPTTDTPGGKGTVVSFPPSSIGCTR